MTKRAMAAKTKLEWKIKKREAHERMESPGGDKRRGVPYMGVKRWRDTKPVYRNH